MKKSNGNHFAAISRAIAANGHPILARYDIARIAWEELNKGAPDSRARETSVVKLNRTTYIQLEQALQESGLLRNILPKENPGIFALPGANISDSRMIACTADPFCYVSHLSAMEFHRLTNRLPEHLYLTTPSVKNWATQATSQMKTELAKSYNEFLSIQWPRLRYVAIPKLNGQPVHTTRSSQFGAFRVVAESRFRVTTIGRTYLDMVRAPRQCGGLHHVIEAYLENARQHLRLIVDEFNQHASPIDKVRAGFILTELMSVSDPRIDAWAKFASRGGSRKLDAEAEFEPRFSERWALSINTELPVQWTPST